MGGSHAQQPIIRRLSGNDINFKQTETSVRSIDIVEELGYKKSSISVAMKNLRERNHIEMSKEGFITLTPSGRQIAEMIYDRHQCLTKWLTTLGVDPEVAAEDACQMEHVISQESFNAIKKHIVKVIE